MLFFHLVCHVQLHPVKYSLHLRIWAILPPLWLGQRLFSQHAHLSVLLLRSTSSAISSNIFPRYSANDHLSSVWAAKAFPPCLKAFLLPSILVILNSTYTLALSLPVNKTELWALIIPSLLLRTPNRMACLDLIKHPSPNFSCGVAIFEQVHHGMEPHSQSSRVAY